MARSAVGCTVLIDGVAISDGCLPFPVDDPAVLAGLRVIWGRDTPVDQPQPSSCTFTIEDPTDSTSRLIPALTIGRRVDVRVDTIVYPDPNVSTIPTMIPTKVTEASATATSAKVTTLIGSGSGRAAMVTFPPRALSNDPLAWDSVPRALAGQDWRLRASITLPAIFLGWVGWAATIQPVAYTNPNGSDATPFGPEVPFVAGVADALFAPTPGVWLGAIVRVYPVGPRWMDLDDTPWGTPGATVTNLATNPAPGSVNGWGSNNNAKWTVAYAAGEVSVTRLAAADANQAASLVSSGLIVGNPVLPLGVNYQRSVEIWVDAAGTVGSTGAGAYVAGQALPANQWTRVVQQFTGEGVARYVLAITVNIPGVGTGVHVKLRRGQLMANPSGVEQPYFDGSTPDAAGIDYAWTGTANASTSTATSAGTGVDPVWTWNSLSTFVVRDLDLLAPAAGAASSAYVFSGRITDLIVSWDGSDSLQCDVIAQDWLAELANRTVGDQPWVMESINTRAQRIVTNSGQGVTLTVDSTIGAYSVTWRDVDRQPAATLLQQLATSAAGILWTATHPVTGQVMWMEDPSKRPAALTLRTAPPVIVIPSSGALKNALPISACLIDADPVRFVLDTVGTVSEVDLTWKEQTTDPGPPVTQRPTDRTIVVTDPALAAVIGARRLSVSTQLANVTQAGVVAGVYMARSSVLAWQIEGLSWDTFGDLHPAEVSALMRLLDGTRRIGLPIALMDLPEWAIALVARQEVALYVEGGEYRYEAGAWVVSLNTTAATGSAAGSYRWQDSPTAWTWNSFDASVTWLDLYGVTYPDVAA